MTQRAGQGRPETWELLPAGRSPALGELLRLGDRAVPVVEIRGFVASTEHERDGKPALVTVAVFVAAALLFLIGVADIGWRTRFLVATAVFGGIALTALNDLFWMTETGLFRVEILTTSGETIRYTTVDGAAHMRLMTVLGAIVGANSAKPIAAAIETPHHGAPMPAPMPHVAIGRAVAA